MKIVAFKVEGNGTFSKDVPAFAEAIKASGAEIVLLPGNSRVKRSAAAAAMRAGAEIDTNVVDVEVADGKVLARRWVYRQRIFTTFSRAARARASSRRNTPRRPHSTASTESRSLLITETPSSCRARMPGTARISTANRPLRRTVTATIGPVTGSREMPSLRIISIIRCSQRGPSIPRRRATRPVTSECPSVP